MSHRASGTFNVKLTPLATYAGAEAPTLGRMSIDKQYQGDLTATGIGEMLTAGTATKGSAGYVAMERVTGTLQGRDGSFALQHSGTMTRGEGRLVITVVPDSGTGQLEGLTGTLAITSAAGKHSYDFDYTAPRSLLSLTTHRLSGSTLVAGRSRRSLYSLDARLRGFVPSRTRR
mgnify:CR=1 FL=1